MSIENRNIFSVFNGASGAPPRTPLQSLLIDPLKASGYRPITPMTQLLGKDYANSAVLKTDTGKLQSGASAVANIGAHQTATNVKAELKEVQASFKEEVADVQAALTNAMDAASVEMNIDPSLARNTFLPPPPSETLDALANKYTSGATTAYDIVSALPKLSPEQESKLVARMLDMMTPKRDPVTEKVIEPPKIKSNYAGAIEELGKKGQFTPEFLKEAMKPAEEQPEWEAMTALEKKLDGQLDVHEQHEDSNETIARIEQKTGFELDAREIVTVDPEIVVSAVTLAGEALNDPDFSGVKTNNSVNVTDITEMLKRNKTPEQPAHEIPPPLVVRVMGMDGMMG